MDQVARGLVVSAFSLFEVTLLDHQVASHLFEDTDEELADDLALALGVGHPGQGLEESVGGLHVDQVDVELAAEGLLHLLGLVGPHEPGVDVDTGELVTDGLVH